jgi:murein DD-endopeptidase MepM/ murein hydrolase activator NlpD
MKKLTAVAAFVLMLLPTHLPLWLDTAPRLGGETLHDGWRRIVHGTIAPRGTIASALAGVIAPASVQQLVDAARPVYDLARVAAGRPFGIALGRDGLLRAFSYGIDGLRTLHVAQRDGRLVAELRQREYETRKAVVSGTIETSLFGAVERAGEGDQLAIDLAEVFQWDVDFNTELQPGDGFRVVVEKQYLDDGFARYGRILAAELDRGPRLLRAVRHEGRAGAGYYGPDGRPLRKAFLRSPLRFTRISSRFTLSRLHPILGVRRPHLGVDYAAPAGTPVQAAAEGVVVVAGWEDGYGKTVRVRHANGYETLYGHLSRIDVRRGQRVSQGDRVGAVGATGLATGPHLDYRMVRNGQFVDPLRIQLPPAEPVTPGERASFDAEAARLLALLTGSGPTRKAATAEPVGINRGY